ncbi:ATP-binding cassette domain-containing protein [Nocardioides sp. Y6]|uniref:ATP-binding cassette domain-containing protein n=1 Tax=Nocardioides malaquae TaxID=2773426 RepID=A0ABR9RQS6_9ACTN|nr:ATP-binding cassette domain-containing protein [Nocardioides malaquae]MBE7323922.1 ATP-binding cassette domain-containing protein [Nocardioides malaquae]
MSIYYDAVTFTHRRRRTPAVRDVTWSPGSARTALLGPNGAGKSTLMRLGAGLLRPESGTVRSSHGRPVQDEVGWMPQDVLPVPGLKAWEQVAYAGWLRGLSRAAAARAADQALDQVGLTDQRELRTSTLSGGQRRRVGLAQALVSEPSILLLDEPTAGLDPAQRRRFREVLAGIPASTGIVVSTHQVEDLVELFDLVVVLDGGRLTWQGTMEEFLTHGNDPSRRAESAYEDLLGGDL